MHLTDEQRRTLLNLWCRVARADGVVDDAELDRLSQLFYELGDGVLTAEEVDLWLENGPPEPECLLPLSVEHLFLERARTIIAADEEVQPAESAAVKQLLKRHFMR